MRASGSSLRYRSQPVDNVGRVTVDLVITVAIDLSKTTGSHSLDIAEDDIVREPYIRRSGESAVVTCPNRKSTPDNRAGLEE